MGLIMIVMSDTWLAQFSFCNLPGAAGDPCLINPMRCIQTGKTLVPVSQDLIEGLLMALNVFVFVHLTYQIYLRSIGIWRGKLKDVLNLGSCDHPGL